MSVAINSNLKPTASKTSVHIKDTVTTDVKFSLEDYVSLMISSVKDLVVPVNGHVVEITRTDTGSEYRSLATDVSVVITSETTEAGEQIYRAKLKRDTDGTTLVYNISTNTVTNSDEFDKEAKDLCGSNVVFTSEFVVACIDDDRTREDIRKQVVSAAVKIISAEVLETNNGDLDAAYEKITETVTSQAFFDENVNDDALRNILLDIINQNKLAFRKNHLQEDPLPILKVAKVKDTETVSTDEMGSITFYIHTPAVAKKETETKLSHREVACALFQNLKAVNQLYSISGSTVDITLDTAAIAATIRGLGMNFVGSANIKLGMFINAPRYTVFTLGDSEVSHVVGASRAEISSKNASYRITSDSVSGFKIKIYVAHMAPTNVHATPLPDEPCIHVDEFNFIPFSYQRVQPWAPKAKAKAVKIGTTATTTKSSGNELPAEHEVTLLGSAKKRASKKTAAVKTSEPFTIPAILAPSYENRFAPPIVDQEAPAAEEEEEVVLPPAQVSKPETVVKPSLGLLGNRLKGSNFKKSL